MLTMAEMTVPRSLSAKYTGDFAYPTIKDRIPVILTKIIDQTCRMKVEVKEKYGEKGVNDLKLVARRLSKLKNEIQTDKPLLPIEDGWRDKSIWTEVLHQETETEGQTPSWFQSPWLYTECYFYRRVHETFQICEAMTEYDPFFAQKCESFELSNSAITSLAVCLEDAVSVNSKKLSTEELFNMFIQVSLWGNKCDLSISSGNQSQQQIDMATGLEPLQQFILVNHSDRVWKMLSLLKKAKPDTSTLGLILDNAGFEFFTDLCLVEFLFSAKLISNVVIYPKSIPWFVSDVTMKDVHWTFKHMSASKVESVRKLAKQLELRIESGSMTFKVHDFWTYPYDYNQMRDVAPELYAELVEADLIIFKGDLNYRKLMQDRKWEPTTKVEEALGSFQPGPICALRTLKADIIVGLKPDQANEIGTDNKDWMTCGEYAVIQSSLPSHSE